MGLSWPCVIIIGYVMLMQIACLMQSMCWARRKGPQCLRALKKLFAPRRSEEQDTMPCPEVEERVAKLLAARRLECSRLIAYTSWVMACILSSAIPLAAFASLHVEMRGLVFVRLVFLTILAFPALYPRCVRGEWSALAIHWPCMAALCVLSLLDASKAYLIHRSAFISMGALVCSGLFLRFRSYALTNVLVTAALVFSSASFLDEDRPFATQAILADVMLLVCRFGFLLGMESLMALMARKEVEASLGQCKQSAVSALLGMMCDAVVDLDSELRLKEHFPKLAGMLMHSEAKSLKGDLLSDFIPRDEGEEESGGDTELARFDLALRPKHRASSTSSSPTPSSSAEDELPAPIMTKVRLRDCIGNRITCVLYHVPYMCIGGQVHHLVGLREDVDPEELSSIQVAKEGELRYDLAERLEEASGRVGPPLAATRPPPAVSAGGGGSRRRRGSRHGQARGQGQGTAALAPSRSFDTSHSTSTTGAEEPAPQPEVADSAEVYLLKDLPVRWSAPKLRAELGLQAMVEGEPLPEFGALLEDGGDELLSRLKELVVFRRPRPGQERFVKCLGEWTLNRGGNSSEALGFTLWANFSFPVAQNEHGVPFIGLAATRRPPRRLEGHTPPGLPGKLGLDSANNNNKVSAAAAGVESL